MLLEPGSEFVVMDSVCFNETWVVNLEQTSSTNTIVPFSGLFVGLFLCFLFNCCDFFFWGGGGGGEVCFSACFHQFTDPFVDLIMLFSKQKYSEVYALWQSEYQQHFSSKFDILFNLILRLTGRHFPNCFPLEQRKCVLNQLHKQVIGASSEDKAWLISVLNTHAEIPDFKNVIAYLLGWCHQNGVGFAKDYEEAVRLFTLSSQQGHSGAQYNLGVCYQNGYELHKIYEEAVRLYTLAAQQGHSDAQNNLGVVLSKWLWSCER